MKQTHRSFLWNIELTRMCSSFGLSVSEPEHPIFGFEHQTSNIIPTCITTLEELKNTTNTKYLGTTKVLLLQSSPIY